MPLIQAQQKPSKKALETELAGEIYAKLQAYRRFSGATTEDIVSGALNLLFEKDTEFAPWYDIHKNDSSKRPPAAQPSHGLPPSGEARKK